MSDQREDPPEKAVQFRAWVPGHDIQDVIHGLEAITHELRKMRVAGQKQRSVIGSHYVWAMVDRGEPTREHFDLTLSDWWERLKALAAEAAG